MPRCRYCNTLYKPARPMQPGRVCNSIECQYKHSIEFISLQGKKKAKESARKEVADRKQAKERLKTLRDWIRETQNAFNANIRERDKNQPCISCGVPLSSGGIGGAFDCGHYRSVGSAPHLRFDERNAHGQCKKCNRWGSGRAVDYRLGLIRRYGLPFVEALEADQTPRKYTIEELKAIKAKYVAKLKELKNGNRT